MEDKPKLMHGSTGTDIIIVIKAICNAILNTANAWVLQCLRYTPTPTHTYRDNGKAACHWTTCCLATAGNSSANQVASELKEMVVDHESRKRVRNLVSVQPSVSPYR